MRKKYSLVLSHTLKKINKNENILSIRPLSNIFELKKKILVAEYPKIKKKELLRRYKFCQTVFESIFNELVIKLNNLHNIDYSPKAWNIITGQYLTELIQIQYKIFLQSSYLFKKYKINKIYTIDTEKFDLCLDNSESIQKVYSDEDWYYASCAKIINFFYKKKKQILHIPKKNKFIDTNINTNRWSVKKVVIIFLSFFSRFIKLFINTNNYSLLVNTYLPFYFEKKLELSLGQLPLIWPKINYTYKKKNIQLRSKIKFEEKKTHSLFETYLRKNLDSFLPKFILEDFNRIKKISENNIYPKNPKIIFSSASFAYDEVFKFYAASKVEKKIQYVIGQHGNNYFTKIQQNYAAEFQFADKYISWGVNKKKKIKGTFNFKTIDRKMTFNPEGKLIIVFDYIDIFPNLFNLGEESSVRLKNIVKVIKKLKPEIRKKTILRVHADFYKKFLGIKYINLLKDLNIEIDNGSQKINNLINGSRINFFTYDSTGMLENFTLNHPTIFFEDKDYLEQINNEYLYKYKTLKNNNIMFTDEDKIANHINNIWDKTNQWWNNKNTQSAIKIFNKNFNLVSKNSSLSNLKKILESMQK
ncbi:hypothetical protein OAB59_00525 [Pelagibacteraceae bacterium]|nr:hypothetical protein [Pelagibacteraceae bacterium]